MDCTHLVEERLRAPLGCQWVGLRWKLSLQQQRVHGAGELEVLFSIKLRAELTRKLLQRKRYMTWKHMVVLTKQSTIRRGQTSLPFRYLGPNSRLLLSASMLLQHGSISEAGQQNKPSLRGLPKLYAQDASSKKSHLYDQKLPGIVILVFTVDC